MKSAGVGAGLIAGVIALIWLGSGFFIVQEGHQAVITTFGRYQSTVDAGWKWRFPYPFQAHAWIEYRGEVVNDVPEHAGFFARLPEQLP